MQGPHQRPITASFLGAACRIPRVLFSDMALSGFRRWLLDCIFRPVPVLCVLVAYRLKAEAEVVSASFGQFSVF
jgi:hypothetical protein